MKPITCRRIVGGKETKGNKTKMEKVFERAGRGVCGCISRMKGSRLLMPHWIVFSPFFSLPHSLCIRLVSFYNEPPPWPAALCWSNGGFPRV